MFAKLKAPGFGSPAYLELVKTIAILSPNGKEEKIMRLLGEYRIFLLNGRCKDTK